MASINSKMVIDRPTRIISELLVGASELLALPYERTFSPVHITTWAGKHWEIPIIAVVAYLAFCFGGKYIMSNYNAFDLRLPLAGWNAFLCLFSFLGMCRTVRKASHSSLLNLLLYSCSCHTSNHLPFSLCLTSQFYFILFSLHFRLLPPTIAGAISYIHRPHQ